MKKPKKPKEDDNGASGEVLVATRVPLEVALAIDKVGTPFLTKRSPKLRHLLIEWNQINKTRGDDVTP